MAQTFQRRIIIYLILLIVLTGLVSVLNRYVEAGNLFSAFIMWTPGITALLASILTKRSIKLVGWKFSFKWSVIAWLFPIVYGLIAYGSVWLFGLGDVPNPTFLERARFTLGMSSASDSLIIISAFFYITIVNLIPASLMALGEEIGWRGYLVPELTNWVGLKKAGWMSGLIWAVWHLPGILSGEYSQHGTPVWFQIICFSVMVVSTGMILAWIRMQSGSIWPAVIFHATHNGVIQMFFDRITLDTGKTAYYTGEFGFALVPVLVLIAVYVYRNMDSVKT